MCNIYYIVLTDGYHYQTQNVWQNCRNPNRKSVMHILRFRKRGRPETWYTDDMEKALFELFHDGRSLSQASVDNEIPYPTIIRYANKVQDLLGPCADKLRKQHG
jgi:hypothetical protein